DQKQDANWSERNAGHPTPISTQAVEVCPAAADAWGYENETRSVSVDADGQAKDPIRLPSLRVAPAPLAGPVPRLRRVEYARPGSGRGVEHLRGEAQFARRRSGNPARGSRNAGGAAGAASKRTRRVRPGDRRGNRRGLS